MKDGPPKLNDFPAKMGGSGVVMAEQRAFSRAFKRMVGLAP
jgi:hypothetical protein